ncbi:MAG: hypothetical protein ACREPT_11055, partial [Rudaea sp.]
MRHPALVSFACVALVVACLPAPSARSAHAADATTALAYPEAKRGSQSDNYHGIEVADPYRWLETLDAPDTRTWIEAENKLSSAYLAQIPGRDRLKQRLTELWNFERYSPPQLHGGKYFYTRNDGLQNQAVLYVADSLDSAPRVLLDPNALSADGTVALKGYAISDDGKYLAYGLSSGGSDWEEWHVLDVASGKDTGDLLKWVKFSTASWRRDGTGFFYSRYDQPKGDALKTANRFQKLYFHRLGDDQQDDLLFYEDKEQPDWRFNGKVSDDGHYLLISVYRGTEPKNLVLYRDLAKRHEEKQPKAPRVTGAQGPGPQVGGKHAQKQPKKHVLTPIETLIGDWDASYEFLGNKKSTLFF